MPISVPGETAQDYRARAAAEKTHRNELRRRDLAEQTSELNTPEKRIRIWEQLHVLGLPLEPAHPLLNLIARETGLTMDQVRTEQSQRQTTIKAASEKPRGINDPYCVLSSAKEK